MLKRLRKDRSLTKFLDDAKTCVTSGHIPHCFTAFVKPGMYFPEAKSENTDW